MIKKTGHDRHSPDRSISYIYRKSGNMKKLAILFTLFISVQATAQENYWQQKIYYNVDVSLDDNEKKLTGKESIIYKNNSPESLPFIWLHLWPNAYKNDSTALFKQISADKSRSKKLGSRTLGSIDGLSFLVNGQPAVTEAHPIAGYIDVVKLILPASLKPGDSLTITTPFNVKLPAYFSRSGYADGEFMVCQWYVKPAVYDKDGWHEMPYLDMGEFYSEYGDYNVNITLPSEYVVAATGSLQTSVELAMYKSVGRKNSTDRSGKPALYVPADKAGTKTLRYTATNVPDFAWFAKKEFIIQYDTVQLNSGRVVDAFTYYYNNKGSLWKSSIDYVKNSVHFYSDAIGNYDYPVVQAVEGPKNNSSGGMEYPMVTLITSPDAKAESLDAVIAHEVGHNWFMSMLGSNERMHTWLDEGLNTYFQFRYEAEKYRANMVFGAAIPESVKRLPAEQFQAAVYQALINIPMQSAIATPAADFKTSDEYGMVSYIKTALWMYLLEKAVGKEKVDLAFKNYFNQWKHKHPQPLDMKTSFEKTIGGRLDTFFGLLNKEGKLE
jgi:hypothetical protein